MNIHIKTTNLTLTPDIQDYLDKKIESFDKLIDPTDTSVSYQVELGRTSKHHKSGDIFRAEINLRKDGRQFRAVSEQDTLLSAIDEAKDEMLEELKSYKSKRTTLIRRGGAAIKDMIKGIGSFGGNIGSNIGGRIKRWRGRG